LHRRGIVESGGGWFRGLEAVFGPLDQGWTKTLRVRR
jgi:hypothetical protein